MVNWLFVLMHMYKHRFAYLRSRVGQLMTMRSLRYFEAFITKHFKSTLLSIGSLWSEYSNGMARSYGLLSTYCYWINTISIIQARDHISTNYCFCRVLLQVPVNTTYIPEIEKCGLNLVSPSISSYPRWPRGFVSVEPIWPDH